MGQRRHGSFGVGRAGGATRKQNLHEPAMNDSVQPSREGAAPRPEKAAPADPVIPPPEALPRLPPRLPDTHKGDYGRVLLIGGSQGMAGAVALAGMAALRSGAGLVQLAVPQSCQAVVAGFEPSYMVAGLPERDGCLVPEARERLSELLTAATVVACGPGMGRGVGVTQLVGWLFARLAKPLVIDADGLNALAESGALGRKPVAARLLTPHPGEFRRLAAAVKLSEQGLEDAACSTAAAAKAVNAGERRQRYGTMAQRLAERCGATVILKGHGTVITDGTQLVINTTGNPGMATGGTGDVLTGVIAALVAQGMEPFSAARLGVFVHGLAGDLAAAELGQVSLIASDLIRFLPRAFRMCEATLPQNPS